MKWNQTSGMASQKREKTNSCREFGWATPWVNLFVPFLFYKNQEANISGEEDKQMGRTWRTWRTFTTDITNKCDRRRFYFFIFMVQVQIGTLISTHLIAPLFRWIDPAVRYIYLAIDSFIYNQWQPYSDWSQITNGKPLAWTFGYGLSVGIFWV